MPGYIVTLKPDVTDEQFAAAKKDVEKQGGKIGHEYTSVFKGFSVEFPKDSFQTLKAHEHVEAVEVDGEVKTQKKD